ncbi:MAG: hypothetical protein Greene041619_816 [Candidatus Peregrinibacteria bacterium Greene0416_19]|nr:MAG: hypothetical protein Greene041619_816 [Candidatus Peregrinibacteria bacterium Greene0416_19]
MSAILAYINGAIEELHHVRWPTRRQAVRLSVIVTVFCVVAGAAFGLIDAGLSELVRRVLSSVL